MKNARIYKLVYNGGWAYHQACVWFGPIYFSLELKPERHFYISLPRFTINIHGKHNCVR